MVILQQLLSRTLDDLETAEALADEALVEAEGARRAYAQRGALPAKWTSLRKHGSVTAYRTGGLHRCQPVVSIVSHISITLCLSIRLLVDGTD